MTPKRRLVLVGHPRLVFGTGRTPEQFVDWLLAAHGRALFNERYCRLRGQPELARHHAQRARSLRTHLLRYVTYPWPSALSGPAGSA